MWRFKKRVLVVWISSADIISDVGGELKEEEVKQRTKENGGHQKPHLLVTDWAWPHLASAFIPCDVSRKDFPWHFLIRFIVFMYLAFVYHTTSHSGGYLALRNPFSREISHAVQPSIHPGRLCQGVQGWVVTPKVFAIAGDRRHRFWRPTRKVVLKFRLGRLSHFPFSIFFERFEGIEDVSQFLSMCKYLSGFKFEIYQEVHSVHEVLLDWRLSVSNKTL